jgi:hypothetical protein
MATYVLTDPTAWVHSVAVHDVAHTMQLAVGREAKDKTVFGHSARANAVGLFTASLSVSGYADMTDFDAALWDLLNDGTTAAISVSPTGVDGETAYALQGLKSSLSPLSGQVGEMAAVSLEAGGRGGVRPVRGTILHPETARTTSGTGTGRQLGAVAAGSTVYGALHVVTASAADTLDVIVQSDDNASFTTPTTRLTFTQATGKTAEWKSAAGAITDDYWRVSYTIAGTSPSFTFAVVVGIATD